MKNLFSLLFLLPLLSCGKAEIKAEKAEDTSHLERNWETWDTCSQKPGDHPCNFKLVDQDGKEVELAIVNDVTLALIPDDSVDVNCPCA